MQSSGDRSVETADGRAATNSLHDAYAILKIARNSFHGNIVAAPSHTCACAGACAIFGSECCVHFETSDLGTSACGDVYVTQVFFDISIHICEHTHCIVCTCARVCAVCSFALGDEVGKVQLGYF